MQNRSQRGEKSKTNWAALRRAMGYNRHYSKIMLIAYGTLLIATLAQLAVPALVRRLIDAVTMGVTATNALQSPVQLQRLLEQTGLTREQVITISQTAETTIITAALVIIVFAAVRGVFAFLQSYNAGLSQSVLLTYATISS
jgi:ATP-binding cassette subfamily B protein